MMKINLIVIKTHKLHELVDFYKLLGLDFDYHQHGSGVFHYVATINEIVFEIYPLPKKTIEADTTTRLGFEIENLDALILKLQEKNIKIVSLPSKTEFGYIAVVEDLDGRKIELTEKVKAEKLIW